MQKVEDIKVSYKQCQDVLNCAEKRLQTNGLGVTTEGKITYYNRFILIFYLLFFLDLVATAKNVYTGMITAGSKANQTHKLVEVKIYIFLLLFLYLLNFRILNIVFLVIKLILMMFNYFLFVYSNKLDFPSYEYLTFLLQCV